MRITPTFPNVWHPSFKRRVASPSKERSAAYEQLQPGRRAQYDSVLSDWKGPIMGSTMPVEILRTQSVNLSRLLTQDGAAALDGAIGQLEALAPNNSDVVSFLRAQYEEAAEPSEGLKKAYAEALAAHQTHVTIAAEVRAAAIGVEGVGADDVAAVQLALTGARTNIEKALEGQGARKHLELISGQDTGAYGNDEAIRSRMLEVFDREAAIVQELESDRIATIEQRLALTPATYLGRTVDGRAPDRLLIGIQIGFDTTWLAMKIDVDSALQIGDDFSVANDADVRRYTDNGYDVVVAKLGSDIPPQGLIDEVLNRHYERWLSSSHETYQQPEPPHLGL